MSWRTIDIDQYDEDAYTEDEILADFDSGLSPEQIQENTQTRATDVRNLMTRGDAQAALVRALEDPPYGRNVDSSKETSIQVLTDVLNLFRATDIAGVLQQLNREQQETLMNLTEAAGTGCIVRVMTDKRSLTVA
ncbi:actin-related protein 2/3 complex subunit 5 [Radiomyces spectabilis]|uniref:actin-related protein 2/3 complex subunit 5 n=1 Tax=Radiomyces spectabilis TaxID=64574 RepID=UPI00222032E8|nr:actin-related protein 2/3 complex subunit 5 [Radiomyces spectabilis]KAI8384511.1 actin-related protein 2/3 complex subunit 5 [Radiomyces spectabilis]